MANLKWSRDGDQSVAKGEMGEYRVTPWIIGGGENEFMLRVHRKRDGLSKWIGGFTSLKNAKDAAHGYENYRATA